MDSAKDLAQRIIADNKLCYLATASLDGTPEVATIQYSEKGFLL